MNTLRYLIFFVTLTLSLAASAEIREHNDPHPMGPAGCEGDMEVWDYSMGMCMPRAMPEMPMKMAMVMYNAFLTQGFQEGSRGRNAFAAPNMVMTDVGTTIGDRQYINLDFMGTFERWTYPEAGMPELTQIGETQSNGTPFIDAQHPHSSPIMGLTLSDTISIGDGKDHLKIWFAPRGQSTDGPVSFMHRTSGLINPYAPLGHHIGQDVGHISSTVFGGSFHWSGYGATTIEASTFNGTEPEPSRVDLPVATPNSYAARIIEQFNPQMYAMASAAYVKNPEPDQPALDHVWRYSASLYNDHLFQSGWMLHNSLIYGLINFYDLTPALNSFAEEFWLHRDRHNIWGRLEAVQRTPAELQIPIPPTSNANDAAFVTAVTLGYTHRIAIWESGDVGLGASLTKTLLPKDYQPAYSGNPLSALIFLQVSGMKMWDDAPSP